MVYANEKAADTPHFGYISGHNYCIAVAFHALSEAQFGPLPGAVFTIDLESKEAAWAFIDKLQVIRRATNLFDRKSLAIHPASTIFGLFTPEQCAEMSVPDTTVRLSIGLEAGEDLLEDIKQSLR